MHRLASPIGDLKSHYDVVVVGSGYGAAVAASRLARARRDGDPRWRLSVCVLERGREFQPGEYPDTLRSAASQTQITTRGGHIGRPTGLYDIRLFESVGVLLGCGLGGTSQINANVVIEPREEVFQSADWPPAIRAAAANGELKDYFAWGRSMLGAAKYPRAPQVETDKWYPPPPWPALPRLAALHDVALPSDQVAVADIAVSFQSKINQFGVQQRACTLCGDCVTGCNFAAKNTLIMNYLPDARNHGAKIFCGIRVSRIARTPRDDGWLVYFEIPESGARSFGLKELFIHADNVVLGAGALGTTEILLRSKQHGLALSDRVGDDFSGNADIIAFGYNADREIRAFGRGRRPTPPEEAVGPTITGYIDRRSGTPSQLIQDGVVPSALAQLSRFFLPVAALLVGTRRERKPLDAFKAWGRALVSLLLGPYRGAQRRTQVYLVMGQESAEGHLLLEHDRLRISWPRAGYQRPLEQAREVAKGFSFQTAATHLVTPFWSRVFGHRFMTVHPLGGCRMADRAEDGVVNDRGQVFDGPRGTKPHRGLYVSDGSVVPRALSSNPLLTITALSERAADGMASDLGAKVDRKSVSAVPHPRRRATGPDPSVGLTFSERMQGTFEAKEPGYKNSPLQFILTVFADDLEALITDKDHSASMVGVLHAPGLAGDDPLLITDGRFHLFYEDRKHVDTRLMRYAMTLTAPNGKRFYFCGAKEIKDKPGALGDMFHDVTTLTYEIREYDDPRILVGEGTLRISVMDVIRELLALRVTGGLSRRDRWKGRLRFIAYFMTSLYKVFGWAVGSVDIVRPYRRAHPAVDTPTAERVYPLATEDRVEIKLTRIPPKEGSRRRRGAPLLLAPGYGMSTYCLRLPTVVTNVTQYFHDLGYDVWLLDYRGSERTSAWSTQFTMDEIARYDWPAAVHFIRTTVEGETGVHDGRPHVIAHCTGSATFLMALLGGWLHDGDTPLVRSAVCSQFFTHFDQPFINRLKAFLPTAQIMELLGKWPRPVGLKSGTVNPDVDSNSPFTSWIWDESLHLYPTIERCRNPVCRRSRLLYGDIFRHEQLNADTHDAMYYMMDRTNVTIFGHIAKLLRRGRLVDKRGRNTYLRPENAKDHLNIPIALIQGNANTFFRPRGADWSLGWMRQFGPQALQTKAKDRTGHELFRLQVIEKYGHLDTFIGRSAASETFPVIRKELDNNRAILRGL